MADEVRSLPEYGNPPVDEVVLGVLHGPLENASTVIGVLREQLLSDFPGVQYQPRLMSGVEPMTDEPQFMPVVQQIPPQPSAGRTWLISRDDSLLLQVQDDRFLLNWRRRERPYPRYAFLRDRFASLYGAYQTAVEQASPNRLQPLQAEFSYINWVSDLKMDSFLRPASDTVVDLPGFDSRPSQQQWAGIYTLRESGSPIARLSVVCVPALRFTSPPGAGVRLELTFKSPLPPGCGLDAIEQSLDEGHSASVLAFTQLTTEEAHKAWDLK